MSKSDFWAWVSELSPSERRTAAQLNTATDIRRARRELTADELRRLFEAARGSERAFSGLTGRD